MPQEELKITIEQTYPDNFKNDLEEDDSIIYCVTCHSINIKYVNIHKSEKCYCANCGNDNLKKTKFSRWMKIKERYELLKKKKR